MTAPDQARLEREILLRAAFPEMPQAAHARFVEVLEDLEIDAGGEVFSVGEAPEWVYFLTQGRVAMEAEGETPWFFKPVAVLGAFDATLERPRKRSCRALEPSKFLVMRSNEWFDLLEDNAQIARAAIRNFAQGLHARWRELAAKVAQPSEPPPGRVPVKLEQYEKLLTLRQTSFVNRAGMQALVSLASVAESVSLRAGEVLVDAGGDQEKLHVVASGMVEVSQGDDFRVRQGVGELVGGPAALCRALSGYAARALTNAELLRISEQDFYDRAEEHPRLTRAALAYLVSELETMLTVHMTTDSPAPLVPLTPYP